MSATAIDLFAGGGGTTEGATRAGVRVLWAANHWPLAVDIHQANHPDVAHLCQDLHQAHWAQVPRADLLLASPACPGHSRARGRERPHHDRDRSTAWAVVAATEALRPRAIVVENVPDFTRWALYPAWCDALQRCGLALTRVLLDAADLGLPQHRRRLFVVGTRSRAPLPLPLPPPRPHVPAERCIDWDAPGWKPLPLARLGEATRRQIAHGLKVRGPRFLVTYYGADRTRGVSHSVERPLGTVTTRDRFGLVDSDRWRMVALHEYARAQGFPPHYHWPKGRADALRMIGNAVPPAMAETLLRSLPEVL